MKNPNNKNKSFKKIIEENVTLSILGFCVTTAIIVGSATFALTTVIISDKNDALEQKVNSYEKKEVELTHNLNSLKKELDLKTQEKDGLKSKLTQYDDIDNRINILLERSKKSSEKITKLENDLKIKERELTNLSQIRKENEEIIKKNNDLVNRNRYLSSELNKLTNINKEIKKLEVKEEKYRECHSWILPKPKELVEQCKHDLKYVQDELSKLRQKLPY